MIVFDLRCRAGHVFEAWFGSSTAYADQREAGLIACPTCGDSDVEKAVMAPNIGAKGNRATSALPEKQDRAEGQNADSADSTPAPAKVKAAMAKLAKAQKQALQGSEWVGMAFADRARAMHLGEADAAPIHGQASLKDARDLIEEGVSVAPLPFPVVPPKSSN